MKNNYEAEIKACLEKYETILREQIARAERMEQDAGAVDFTKKEKIIIFLPAILGLGCVRVTNSWHCPVVHWLSTMWPLLRLQ